MYRMLSTEFWAQYGFLSRNALHFFSYLIHSSYTKLCGINFAPVELLAAESKFSVQEILVALKELEERNLIVRENGLIWIKNFIATQVNNQKAAKKAVAELLQIVAERNAQRIKDEFIKTYKQFAEFVDTLSIPYPYPIDTLSIPYPTDTDTDTDTVSDTDTENIEHTNVCLSSQHGEDLPLLSGLNGSNGSNGTKIDKTPYQQIIDLYHRLCPDLPRVKVLNEARKRLIRARWREHPDFAFWEDFFKRVNASDFLCGRVALRDDKPPFVADLEWLVRPTNFAKVLEGKYDNRKSRKELEEEEYYASIRRKLGIE